MTARIQPPLQCVHCHTTETPLWRAGPLGPKTLCNACGVRWKKTGSVIPRAKRPSSSPPNNKNSSNVRKRPRVNSDNLNHAITSPSSNPSLGTALNSNNNNISSNSNSNSNSNNSNSNNNNNNNINNSNSNSNKNSNIDPPSNNNNNNKSDRLPNHHQHQSVDSAARVAAASMPAPRPISVFRVSDVQRSKYESVFSGLMVVPRPRDGSLTSSNLNNILQNHYQQNNNNNNNSNNIKSSDGDFIESRAIRTRTQTPKASAYFSDLSASLGHANQNHKDSSNRDDAIPPSPSPPPIDLSLTNSVYVTEVHAPSPSPSPPPMPRKRVAEGGGFRLVLSTVADERNE